MTHVKLRPIRPDDLPIFFEHQADPVAAAMAAFPSRDREAFDAHWARILRDERNVVRTVELEGQPAGNVVSWEHDGERDVGYWVGREHWGKGVATAALTAFLDVVRTRPLHAHVVTTNPASIRVLEKCGFRRASAPTVDDDGIEELHFRLD
jgi:RimJ/RimL family protein N-acetyltransferase